MAAKGIGGCSGQAVALTNLNRKPVALPASRGLGPSRGALRQSRCGGTSAPSFLPRFTCVSNSADRESGMTH